MTSTYEFVASDTAIGSLKQPLPQDSPSVSSVEYVLVAQAIEIIKRDLSTNLSLTELGDQLIH